MIVSRKAASSSFIRPEVFVWEQNCVDLQPQPAACIVARLSQEISNDCFTLVTVLRRREDFCSSVLLAIRCGKEDANHLTCRCHANAKASVANHDSRRLMKLLGIFHSRLLWASRSPCSFPFLYAGLPSRSNHCAESF